MGKQIFHILAAAALILGLTPASAVASSAPAGIPEGAVIVAKDGSGQFTTIQQAIFSLRDYKPEGRAWVYVKKGVYEEKLLIPAYKTEVSLIGEDRDETVIIWHDHANLPSELGRGGTIGTFYSWTMKVDAPDFICENFTIINDAMTYHNPSWHEDHENKAHVGQAVALHIEADRVIFRNCKIKGFQDTLFTGNNDGREYFENCYIEGAVDFMFGPATVWFEQCHVHLILKGYFTAASTPADHPYGYVFNRCKLTAAEGLTGQWLGRPWRNYAYVLWKECEMDVDLNPAGWNNWGDPAREKTARYYEYNCTGKGADRSGRAPWSHELSKKEARKVTLSNVFNQPKNTWIP